MKSAKADELSVASRVSRILSDRAAQRRRITPSNQYGNHVSLQKSIGSSSRSPQFRSAGKNQPQEENQGVTDKSHPNMRNLLLKSNSQYQRSEISEPAPKLRIERHMNTKRNADNVSTKSKHSVTSLSLRRFNDLIQDARSQQLHQEGNLNLSQASRRSSRNGNAAPSMRSSHGVLNLIARRNQHKAGGCQFRDAHLAKEDAHACKSKIYRMNLCKRHYLDTIKHKILNSAKSLYTNPINAFSAMDFNGQGYVTLDGFLKTSCITKLNITTADVMEFLRAENLFDLTDPNSRVNFEKISRTLFPQMYQIKRDDQLEKDGELINNLKGDLDQAEGNDIVSKRLRDLEAVIIERFSSDWQEVKKAFLDMDFDHDGYLTIEDFVRLFANNSSKINMMDLKKLLLEKDSTKKGRLNYQDFSQWLGQAIHWSEGFYFRHDSIKNPPYERGLQAYEKRMKDNKVAESLQKLRNAKQLETLIWQKLGQQWKTVKKAFRDLSNNEAAGIQPSMLRRQLENWGLNMTDEQFEPIFKKFDLDGDGVISFRDFLDSAGPECFPKEGLFFRQDISIKQRGKDKVCKHPYCCVSCVGLCAFCAVHLKLHREKGLEIFMRVKQKISSKKNKSCWGKFMTDLISEMESISTPDSCQVEMTILFNLFEKHGAPITDEHKTLLQQVFVVTYNNSNDTYMLNVSKLMNLQVHQDVGNYYNKTSFGSDKQVKEVVDLTGYHGLFFREKVKLHKLKSHDFIGILADEVKFTMVMRTIRQIDKDRNGYITNQEMEDIIRMFYPNELADKDIEPHIHKYTSPLNRVLVDYKQLCTTVTTEIDRTKVSAVPANNLSQAGETRDVVTAGPNTIEKDRVKIEPRTSYEKYPDTEQSQRKASAMFYCTQNDTEKGFNNQGYNTPGRAVSANMNTKLKASKSQNMIRGADGATMQNLKKAQVMSVTNLTNRNGTGEKIDQDQDSAGEDVLSNEDGLSNYYGNGGLLLPHQLRNAKRLLARSTVRLEQKHSHTPNLMRNSNQNSLVALNGPRRAQQKLIIVKQKLQENWKNLFRSLINFYDTEGTGSCYARYLEEALHGAGIYLTKDELQMLQNKFSAQKNYPDTGLQDEVRINYLEMGRVLGLDSNHIRLMVQQKMGGAQIHYTKGLIPERNNARNNKSVMTEYFNNKTSNKQKAQTLENNGNRDLSQDHPIYSNPVMTKADALILGNQNVRSARRIRGGQQLANLTKLYQQKLVIQPPSKRHHARNQAQRIQISTSQVDFKKSNFSDVISPSEMISRLREDKQEPYYSISNVTKSHHPQTQKNARKLELNIEISPSVATSNELLQREKIKKVVIGKPTKLRLQKSLPEIKRHMQKLDSNGTGALRVSQILQVMHAQGIRAIVPQMLEAFHCGQNANSVTTSFDKNEFNVDYVKFLWHIM